MEHCPTDCQQDRRRFCREIKELFNRTMPTWVRAMLISGVLVLFALFAKLQVADAQFVTRAELKAAVDNLEKQGVKALERIEEKLDALLNQRQ